MLQLVASGGMGDKITIISGPRQAENSKGIPGCVTYTPPSGLLCEHLVTSGRSQAAEKCNGNRYINHFYSLTVKVGFYGYAVRVVGSFLS